MWGQTDIQREWARIDTSDLREQSAPLGSDEKQSQKDDAKNDNGHHSRDV